MLGTERDTTGKQVCRVVQEQFMKQKELASYDGKRVQLCVVETEKILRSKY